MAIHPGDKLASYRVTRLLGRGGMGEVWAAVDDRGREAAVKVLLQRAAMKPDLVRRFEREATITRAINSPFVCQLLDVTTNDDGTHLLIFEHLTGESLSDRLKREQYLPLSEVGGLIDDVLTGLVAAHAAGVIHRDLTRQHLRRAHPRPEAAGARQDPRLWHLQDLEPQEGGADPHRVRRHARLLRVHGARAKKNDIASARLNGSSVIDMLELSKKGHTQDILLDTGLNILVLYADNFANGLPNKGKLNLDCGKKKVTLDFNSHADSAASFIAVKLFFAREKDKERFFDSYTPVNDKPLKQNERLLGTLTSTARQLTFAISDDAVEDGDSISVYVNGKWVSRGFPVKLKPQTIVITLEPGPNTIIFSADNL